jgi:hypothetical protein
MQMSMSRILPAKRLPLVRLKVLLHTAAAFATQDATRAEIARAYVGMLSSPAAHLPQLQENAAQARLNATLLDSAGAPTSAAQLRSSIQYPCKMPGELGFKHIRSDVLNML